MKQLSSRRRGIILVVTLLTSVVLLMFLGAALKLVPNQLNETVHSREKLAADTAARSGVAYALSRLQENAGWRASGTNEVVVNSPTLRVVEDLGNVVGYLRASDGSLSQFQIRFNYQNGASATGQWDDNFANPSQMLGIQCVSQNNLSGSAPKDVPTPTESIAIDASTISSLKCARYSCLVQVVGMAGRGVSDAAPAARAQCVSSEAKAVFARSEMQKFDAVAYFGGGLEADLAGLDGADGLFSMDSVDARPSKIRALSNLDLNKGDIKGKPSSEVVLQPGGQVTKPSSGPTAATTSAVRVTNESVTQQKDRWPRTKWSDIPQAKASDSHMPPGTYVWRYDSTQGYVIDHYAQNVVGTVAPTTAHTTYTETDFNATFPDAVRMDAAHLTLEFKDKLYVDTNASVNSLRVTYDDSVRLEGLRPLNYFASSGANKAILSSKGNITLDGVSRGKGSVTSEGDVQFQSSSIFEADPNSAVAIYAKGDVNLTPPSGVQTAAFNQYIQAAPATATSSSSSSGYSASQLSLASSVSLSLATTKFSFNSLANGFSLLVNNQTGGGGGVGGITNPGGGGGNVITYTPVAGYSINPPNVLYSAASIALFSNTATLPALSFDSTGVASTHLITSPFMLQALKIQPTFPLTSNDIGFSGLIYSEGNLNANVPDANLFINGVLCLWGGDSNSDPGSDNNKGRAHVKSLNAFLNYDPSCLLNDSGNSTVLFPAKLDQTYFSLK